MAAHPGADLAGAVAAGNAARKETVSIGVLERIYAALNAISPRLIDTGLAGQIRKARVEFG